MTAIITAASIQRNFPHIDQDNYQTVTSSENPLYNSWVNMTEYAGSDMMAQMLSPEDITASPLLNLQQEVRSIFNSLFIEKIAQKIVDTTVKEPNLKRPYFASDFELLTTLTNLRGFNYELAFITAAGKREDRMTMHKDLAHFQHNPSGIYRNDGKIPFNFNKSEGCNKQLLIDAAIATGAFPVGLAPRKVIRDPQYINDNHLLRITHGKTCIVDPFTKYHAVCVDGGVINNEPYDLTEIILTRRQEERLRRSSGKEEAEPSQMAKNASFFDSTVVMINPFPNYEDQPATNYPGLLSLKYTTQQLFGAMRQQLMIKTELLEKAYDDNDYTRFMIAPIRTKDEITQLYSLACGALGGFGGFFSKKFRTHDYMLGRRNCQRFIQQYFCVPLSSKNPVIEYGYGKLEHKALQFLEVNEQKMVPVIPDIRIAQDHKSIVSPKVEEEFPYPAIELKYLIKLEKKIQKRFGLVLNNFANGTGPGSETRPVDPLVQQIRKQSWFSGLIVNPVKNFVINRLIAIGRCAGKRLLARKFIDVVVTEMAEKGLLIQ